jgi:hypothetical protein
VPLDVLTLLIVPAAFSLADGFEKRLGRLCAAACSPMIEHGGRAAFLRAMPGRNRRSDRAALSPALARRRAPGPGVMRRLAGGLLLAMACLFCWPGTMRTTPRWEWLRAFAEAAMVGGLADWFAVTALFRHPLGLPIPHTAIIPENKDRLADAMAGFLRVNFLTRKWWRGGWRGWIWRAHWAAF